MATKFGLGRGLSDLKEEMGTIPDISILTGTERVVVKQIPLVQIGANPDQPRKTFTDNELTELAASIREKGVLSPIILRSVTGRPYMYEIVAGERRYRAAKMAGLNEIPALVKTLSNENAMEIALIENVQRENLNPIEEGAAYKNLMEKCGYEIADVCRLIGKSESYIRNKMRLDGLPDDVKEMAASGKLTSSHITAIAVADNPSDLAHQIIDGNLSVAETSKLVKRAPRSNLRRTFTDKTMNPDTVHDIESRVRDALGVTVKLIERRGGAGQLVLTFATRVQLQELVEKITNKMN
ncbi:MAG: ParB/RepB/Spo0J family partition protein [Muribaculaceae bacterium]|nr:ParB/RepB/Spo0J family partition protein [Muribaculaceae bacterium]